MHIQEKNHDGYISVKGVFDTRSYPMIVLGAFVISSLLQPLIKPHALDSTL